MYPALCSNIKTVIKDWCHLVVRINVSFSAYCKTLSILPVLPFVSDKRVSNVCKSTDTIFL